MLIDCLLEHEIIVIGLLLTMRAFGMLFECCCFSVIWILLCTTTTLHHLIKPIAPTRLQEHEKSGIYKITCMTCHKAYVGQTSHNLKSRFREHIRYIKNNDHHLGYALHILKCRHEYRNINNTMTLLKQINRPTLLLPYEQMYIQSFHHNNELDPRTTSEQT